MRSLLPALIVALMLNAAATTPALADDKRANDPIAASGREGQTFGRQLREGFAEPTLQENAGERGAGVVTIQGHGTVEVNQLMPGAGNAASTQELSALEGDASAMSEAAAAKHAEIAQDPASHGGAYRTILNQDRMRLNELVREQAKDDRGLWAQTEAVFAGVDSLASDFADCKATVSYFGGREEPGSITREETCEELRVLDGAERRRDIDVRDFDEVLIDTEVAITSDQTDSGTVPSAGIGSPDGMIVELHLDLSWDGALKDVFLEQDPTRANGFAFRLRYDYDEAAGLQCLLPDGITKCERGAPDCACNYTEQRAHVRLTASGKKVSERLVSNPSNLLLDTDQWCSARWTCEESGARDVAGITIDDSFGAELGLLYPNHSRHVPPSSQAPLCWRATAKYDCPYNLGPIGCWTATNGERVCHTNTTSNTGRNTCGALAQRRECALVRQQCNESARGHNDFCYVYTNVYQCTESVAIDTVNMKREFACDSTVRCMGEDCMSAQSNERTTGFPDVQANLSLVQHMLSDYSMTSPGTQAPVIGPPGGAGGAIKAASRVKATEPASWRPQETSKLTNVSSHYGGAPYECRKATGGLLNCCTEASSNGMPQWTDLYQRHLRQANAKIAAEHARADGEEALGAWDELQHAYNWRLSTLDEALTSRVEMANTGPVPLGKSTALGATPALSPVMDAYRREKLQEAPSSGSRCTVQEWDLATLKETGSCVHVGSYCNRSAFGMCIEKRDVSCCFNSPLTKSIRVAMAGGDAAIAAGAFGSAKNPQCGGVGTDARQTSTITSVDLDEWKGRMAAAGALPTAANIAEKTSLEELTGDGSSLSNGGDRANSLDRAQTRLAAFDHGGAKQAMQDEGMERLPPPPPEPDDAGKISFAPAFYAAQRGYPAVVLVARQGSRGAATVAFQTVDGTARAGQHYDSAAGTLHWADGESGIKRFVVRTRAPAAGEPRPVTPLRLKLRLSSPGGGATLDPNSEGDVVLAWRELRPGTTPPPVPGALSITKRLVHSFVAGDSVMPLWEVTVKNTGTAPLTNLLFYDRLPAGVLYSFGGEGINEYCDRGLGVSYEGPHAVARCRAIVPFPPQAEIRLRLQMKIPVADAGVVTNVCGGFAVDASTQAAHHVTEATCRLTSNLGPGPIEVPSLCTPNGTTYPPAGFQLGEAVTLDAIFRRGTGAGISSSLTQVRLNSGTYEVYEFKGEDFPTQTGHYQFNGDTSNIGANAVGARFRYVTISPCPGDLRPPQPNGIDPMLGPACRMHVSEGPYILLSFEPFPGACVVDPTRTYYYNVILDDPSDGYDPSAPCNDFYTTSACAFRTMVH